MKTGMLWYDDNPKTSLEDKIARAAEYYRKKYGASPNLCFVNPNVAPAQLPRNGIEVRTTSLMMPNHLWLGLEGK